MKKTRHLLSETGNKQSNNLSNRIFIALSLILITIASTIVFYHYRTIVDLKIILKFASVAVAMISLSSVLFAYLQFGSKIRSSPQDKILSQFTAYLRSTLKKIESRVNAVEADLTQRLDMLETLHQSDKTQSQDITNDERLNLIDEITSNLMDGSADKVIEILHKRIKNDDTQIQLSIRFSESIHRLSEEVDALGRRGNVNLVLGIATTVVGLILLGIYVYSTQPAGQDPWMFTSHFLPRLTLVIFIEIFAFFFLRLYKSSLMGIKYFQNEMTNIESKYIALSFAFKLSDTNTCKNVITELSRTERNCVLEKGQTTIELENIRAEKNFLSDHITKLLAVIGKDTV